MKKILFSILIFSCLFSFGKCCKKKKCTAKKSTTEATSAKLNPNEVWMQYDETKCANPWRFEWFAKPTEEQLRGAVKGQLSGQDITILEIKSTLEDGLISCDACTCPNGRHYYVRVNISEIGKLKEMKFYEVTDVSDFTKSNDSTTK